MPDYINGVIWGGKLPKSLDQTVVQTNTPQLNFHPEHRYDFNNTVKALHIKTDVSRVEFYETSSAIFTPAMYVPQSAAIFVGRIINAPPILLMYMARLAMLATWIILFAIAIKIMPYKKWAMATVGLLPMALFQAVSLGGDAIIIGLGAIYAALVLDIKFKSKPKISTGQLIALIIIGSLMVLGKAIMIVFIPLVLLISYKRFSSNKLLAYMKVSLLALIPIACYGVWLYIIRDVDTHVSSMLPNGADTTKQLSVLVHSPLTFIIALWNMYFLSWGDHITKSLIGSFGWMDSPLPESIVIIGYVGLALLMFAKDTATNLKSWLTKYEKLFIVLIIGVYFGLVNIAMYLSNTTVGIKLIYGLQGRYFLPILVLFIPLFLGEWLSFKSQSTSKKITLIISVVLLTSSVATLWCRYYVWTT